MSDDGIAELLDRWRTRKPYFAAPELEEYVCSQCVQNARNYVGNVSQDASTLYRNVVQESIQECVLNLNQSSVQTEPTSAKKETGEWSLLGSIGRRELSFLALAALAGILIVLIGFLF
jgi:hypothetical protein